MAIQYGRGTSAWEFSIAQNCLRGRGEFSWRKPASVAGAAVTADSLMQAPHPLSPAELHALYAGTTVPPHRYLAPALITALHSSSIALDPAKWFTDIEDVDLSSVTGAWLRTNSDTTFEQLKCVGLDARAGQLTAILSIKRGRGYAGGTSTTGSQEFVAFWVDWGSGFQYEGTASVAVHDFGELPAEGVDLLVSLPVDLSQHARAQVSAATTIKVRAVLSWDTPPSITHPYAQVVWGNSLDLRIVISSQPAIYSSQEAGWPKTERTIGFPQMQTGLAS